MPMNLTLKNVPDEVYELLKSSAAAHRRSLNSEAIVCLEAILAPVRIAAGERLARARRIRASLSDSLREKPQAKRIFRAKDIEAFKREGRA
jgi:plasmid stability protein